MSYYSTIRGVLVFETEAKRDEVLEDVRDRGWTEENIRAATEEHNGDDKPAIHILRDRYRNLGRTLKTMREPACDWLIVEASGEHGKPAGYVQAGPDGHGRY